MSTLPNRVLLDEDTVPQITIAGKAWPIPMLAPKQNVKVVPAILRVVPKILATGNGEGKFDLKKFAEAVDEASYADLLNIVFLALTRGHPDLSRDEFDNMPVPTMDLVLAVIVIASQTGVIKAGMKPAGDVQLGEAGAGNSQTGTP